MGGYPILVIKGSHGAATCFQAIWMMIDAAERRLAVQSGLEHSLAPGPGRKMATGSYIQVRLEAVGVALP